MPNKVVLLAALLVLLAVLSARAAMRVIEPRFLFFPSAGLEINPAFLGLKFLDVVVTSGPYRLHGWFFPTDPSRRFVIFYHGNAGNIADRLDFVKFLEPLGLNIILIDYRGYGRSEGYPTIEGVEQDGVATLEWLHIKREVPLDRIVLWGRSLGVAAALKAAERYPDVAGVVMESGFVSLRRIATDVYPYLPVALISDALDNGRIAARLPTPKLIIHGLKDTVIPFSHAEELYARAAGPKRIVPVKHAGHGDTYYLGGREYKKIVGEWITGL